MTTTYEQRFVSFIDILGFADAIERSRDDAALAADIRHILSTAPFSSPLHGPPSYPSGRTFCPTVKFTNFSDCVVMSAAATAAGLMTVIEMSRAFACVLLQFGMLARGGVSCGPVVHQDRVLFGPGMVSAYRLESETAKVARIITDDVTLQLADDLAGADTVLAGYLSENLLVDADGRTYLHVLREMAEDVAAGHDDGMRRGWWGTARETIVRELAVSAGKPFANKIEWFASYYNRQLDPTAERERNGWLEPILT